MIDITMEISDQQDNVRKSNWSTGDQINDNRNNERDVYGIKEK